MRPLAFPMNLLALSVTAALALPAQAVTPVAKHAAETAEAARIKALEQKLDQSLSVIEQLKTRLAELERRAAPAAAPVAPAPVVAAKAVPDPRVEQLEADVRNLAAAAASSKPADTGVPFHGFLDVGYQSLSKQSDGKRSGATLGTFDVYLTPQLGSNVRSLIELAFEYGPDGGLGIDLERVQIGYAFSDELVLWGGRFHTPFGYWNTAFHHGAQLQTSITRPRFIAFEDQGGVLPSHTVGGWATGKTPTSFGKVSYDLYAGNGNRIQDGVLDYNAFGDDNGSPIVGFNVGVSPQGFSGLTVGLHGFQQKVSGSNAAGTLTGSVQSRVLGAYGYREGDSFELISEYYRFSNSDRAPGGLRRTSQAAFIQGSYNLVDRMNVFARYEKASLQSGDPYFALQESGVSYHQTSLGLRYDVDPRAAVKLQLDSTRDVASPLGTVHTLRAQYAVRF